MLPRIMNLLIASCLVVLTSCHQYTPQAFSVGNCTDLPVDIHAQVKAKIEEIEVTLVVTEQLQDITSSIQALNMSIQEKVADLTTDIKQLQISVNNLTASPDTGSNPTPTPNPTDTPNPTTNPTDTPSPNPSIGNTSANPASSCSEIPRDRPSGEYWIQNSKTGDSPIQVYCDMTRTCCNTMGGWTRVANIDMRDSNQICPSGLTLIIRDIPPLRTCGRHGDGFGCRRTQFQVPHENYNHVCGRVIGYQKGVSFGFSTGFAFIDGVWLTLANSNTDPDIIWSFTVARDETTNDTRYICPCTRPELTVNSVPSVIGQDYFCDTGSKEAVNNLLFYDMDPLWDGQGCGGTSTCCEFNNPPWFCKQLPHSTSDDIELSLCNRASASDGDSPLEIIELYVR